MVKTATASKKDSEEEGSEQEPRKQLKRGKCCWLDADSDIHVGERSSGCVRPEGVLAL